ncbi:hypothetical protein Hanom_Chr06g00530251 [Helianthus anomalus]
MFGQFTREYTSHSRLNLPRRQRILLVVACKFRCFLSELFENIIDEGVHDPHFLARDPDIRMNLLQNLEDVDLVRLFRLLVRLLLLSLEFLLCGCFLCHCLLSGCGLWRPWFD